jgi:peptidoglycan/LPS O-acetylase OafA/YrhL
MKPRRTPKSTGEDARKKDRILFFDLLRIACVAVIVYVHSQYDLVQGINQFLFSDGFGPFRIYPAGLQGFAIYGMIFVSGAVLEYNYRGLERVSGYAQFIFKRFIRIYPAFWMSLILGIFLFPILIQNNLSGALFEFTGYYVILGKGPGLINEMGWFIAAIFSLYLLFPYLSGLVRKYHLYALIGICLLSWGLRSVVLTYSLIPLDQFWRWFPLFNAFEFCLGIYLVQNRWYPQKANVYPVVRSLADLSFYVFLFHVIIIRVFMIDVAQLRPLVSFDNTLAMNNLYAGYTIYYCQMMAAVLLVSWIAMKADARIQRWILQREAVKKFLGS